MKIFDVEARLFWHHDRCIKQHVLVVEVQDQRRFALFVFDALRRENKIKSVCQRKKKKKKKKEELVKQ